MNEYSSLRQPESHGPANATGECNRQGPVRSLCSFKYFENRRRAQKKGPEARGSRPTQRGCLSALVRKTPDSCRTRRPGMHRPSDCERKRAAARLDFSRKKEKFIEEGIQGGSIRACRSAARAARCARGAPQKTGRRLASRPLEAWHLRTTCRNGHESMMRIALSCVNLYLQ